MIKVQKWIPHRRKTHLTHKAELDWIKIEDFSGGLFWASFEHVLAIFDSNFEQEGVECRVGPGHAQWVGPGQRICYRTIRIQNSVKTLQKSIEEI